MADLTDPTKENDELKLKDKNPGSLPGSQFVLGDYSNDVRARLCYASSILGGISTVSLLASAARSHRGLHGDDVQNPFVLGLFGIIYSAGSVLGAARVKSPAHKLKISVAIGFSLLLSAAIGTHLSDILEL